MSSREGDIVDQAFENRTLQTPQQPQDAQQRLLTLSEILGRKWMPVILYHLFRAESMGFSELLEEIDDISSKVLSENLSLLTDWGFVERNVVCENPHRVEYTVTHQGRTLKPVLIAGLNADFESAQENESEEVLQKYYK